MVGSRLRRSWIIVGCQIGQALVVSFALSSFARGQSTPDESDPIRQLEAAYADAEEKPEAFEAALKAAREDVERVDARSRPLWKAKVDRLESLGLLNMRAWARAKVACEAAIESSRAVGKEDFGAVTDLAQVELMLGQPLNALVLVRRTIDNDYERRATKEDAIFWNGIAIEAYAECGLFDFAVERLKAFAKLTERGSLDDRIDLAFRRVNLEMKLEQYDRALAHANEMLGWKRVSDKDRSEMRVRLGMVQSEIARGRPDDGGATQTLEEALAYVELNIDDKLHAKSILLDLALRAHDLELARRRLADLDECFALLEATSVEQGHPLRRCLRHAYAARLALDSHAAGTELRERRDELAVGIESVWQTWESNVGRAGGVGFLALGTQRMIVSEAMRLEMALDSSERGIENALSVLLRAQRPGTLSRRLGETDLTLADVRAVGCRDGTTLLIVLPAMERSHVFQLESQTLDHFEARSRDELDAAVRALGRITDHPPAAGSDAKARRRDFVHAADALTDLMFDDEARAFCRRWQRVTVIGAQLLSSVPVEFLRPVPGHEVGLEVPIAYVSSMPLLVALERRADRRSTERHPFDLVLVGDPATNSRATSTSPKLDLTDEERASLRAGFARERVLELYGPEATLEAAMTERVLNSAVLAFIAHGHLDSPDEMPAYIELTLVEGRANILNTIAVAGLSRTPRFVELLACRAGSGPLRMGDDAATNLGTAFLAVGTDVVLTSSGDLSVRGSIDVARVLHPAVAGGETTAEGLRRARVALASNPETADPFYRSFLRIEGLGHRALFPAVETRSSTFTGSDSRLWWILAGVVVAALSLLLLMRRKSAA